MNNDINQKVSWQQEIEKYTEALVLAAENTLPDTRMHLLRMRKQEWQKTKYSGDRDKKEEMKKAQFSNFLGLTKSAGNSPAAIRNWIRYQMGREETQANWKRTGLGDAILEQINEMSTWAKEIVAVVFKEPTPEQMHITHVKLISMYAGYLRRAFIAKGGQ